MEKRKGGAAKQFHTASAQCIAMSQVRNGFVSSFAGEHGRPALHKGSHALAGILCT